jgi:hypothetical protein
MNAYWTIPTDDGVQCTNLENGDTVFVSILEVSKEAIENGFNHVDCGPDNFSVFHFPFGRDAGILEAVNRFIADRFNSGPRIFAVCYGKGAKREFERMVQSTDARAEFLRTGYGHFVIPAVCAKQEIYAFDV